MVKKATKLCGIDTTYFSLSEKTDTFDNDFKRSDDNWKI